MEVAEETHTAVTVTRGPRAVRVFSCVAFGAAALAAALLVAAGAPRPAVAPVVLLALAVVLCVNRFALFPTEQAATAEAAVLLAAVVGFRDSAVFLGPLAVGLLVGPLDALHWHQRSYLRMAYNAGNRGLSALAAAAGFVGVRELIGGGAVGLVLATGTAVACLATIDMLLSITLMVLQGTAWRAAARHVVAIDVLTVPIACYGGACGLLAGELGWWATALAIVPAAFVPELMLAGRGWRAVSGRDIALVVIAGGALVALAVVAPGPDVATVAALLLCGMIAGLELAVDDRAVLSPLLALVVVAAVVVVPSMSGYLTAALVAAIGALTERSAARHSAQSRAVRAALTSVGAALLATAVVQAAPTSTPGVMLGALAAGITFEVVVVVVGADRRRTAEQLLWTTPLVAAASAWALAWRIVGLGGAVVFAVAVAVALAAAAWWGAPPWRSRYLAAATVRVAPTWHRAGLAAVCGGALAMSILTADVGSTPQTALLWATVGFGESAVAMVLVGVRQWRFAPRARAGALITLLAATGALALGYPVLALNGSLGAVVLVAAVLLVTVLVGRTPGALADAARPEPRAETKERDREMVR